MFVSIYFFHLLFIIGTAVCFPQKLGGGLLLRRVSYHRPTSNVAKISIITCDYRTTCLNALNFIRRLSTRRKSNDGVRFEEKSTQLDESEFDEKQRKMKTELEEILRSDGVADSADLNDEDCLEVMQASRLIVQHVENSTKRKSILSYFRKPQKDEEYVSESSMHSYVKERLSKSAIMKLIKSGFLITKDIEDEYEGSESDDSVEHDRDMSTRGKSSQVEDQDWYQHRAEMN